MNTKRIHKILTVPNISCNVDNQNRGRKRMSLTIFKQSNIIKTRKELTIKDWKFFRAG